MKLMTKEIIRNLPGLREQEGKGDEAIVHIKFFTPDADWTWYVTEGNPIVVRNGEQVEITKNDLQDDEQIVDWMFFGLVYGFEMEWGYFTLSQLQQIRGCARLPVERDMHFGNPTIGKVKNG